jgi:predicted ATPase
VARRAGVIEKPAAAVAPPASRDRLYLVNAAGLPEYRPVYDALSSMSFYDLNPDRIRSLQSPDHGEALARDGGNIASVIDRLSKQDPPIQKELIEDFLAKVVLGVEGVDADRLGHMETVRFRQRVEGAKDTWRFPALNMSDGTMSDGTLRALGVLVALFQGQPEAHSAVRLVGIEEPETALHPAAAAVLVDALVAASTTKQVLVTSHSPDFLDDDRLTADNIVAVMANEGRTEIGHLDDAGREALSNHLYTAGELLRLDQLQPSAASTKGGQLKLFDENGPNQ